MVAQKEDNTLTVDCKVERHENQFFIADTFQIQLSCLYLDKDTESRHEYRRFQARFTTAGSPPAAQ